MQPDEPLWSSEGARQRLELDARGVGGNQCADFEFRFEIAEHGTLCVGPLDDRFDNEIRGADLLGREVDTQTGCSGGGLAGRAQPLAKQLARTGQRGLDELELTVLYGNGQPLERAPSGDVAAHRAAAHDVDMPHGAFLRREVAQPLAQLEDADEVATRRRDEQAADRRSLVVEGLYPASAVALP